MSATAKVLAALLRCSVSPVGSRVTCNPPPMDTDDDYLCFVEPGALGDFHRRARLAEFERPVTHRPGYAANTRGPESPFLTYRNGETNLIVTDDKDFHRRFQAATAVAKAFNLLNKSDRIALFQAVLYGNPVPERVSMEEFLA